MAYLQAGEVFKMKKMKDLTFEELDKKMTKYFIYGNTYEYKEELKSWACFWVPEKKAWCLETIEDGMDILVIKSLPNITVVKEVKEE